MPHHAQVPSDSEHRIVMPADTKPWFKQYFSIAHNEHFGNEMRYMPLGSREEFEEAPPQYQPPSQRKYVYSFMVAPTDSGRKKVRDILVADTLIPKDRVSALVTSVSCHGASWRCSHGWFSPADTLSSDTGLCQDYATCPTRLCAPYPVA